MKLKNLELEKVNNFFIAFALIYFAIAVLDGVAKYSIVPCADSWDGILGFIINYPDQDFSYWFYQHNEHRIFISRILFWLNDISFGTENWPLITLNYIFAFLSFLTFFCILRESFKSKTLAGTKQTQYFVKSFITLTIFMMMYSKMQSENFDWEFQSQFFLAYLFPLLSLYLLGKSTISKKNSDILFISSCIFGILSAGTMANGVFALPAMAFLLLLLREKWSRILVLTTLSLLVLYLYLIGYQKPNGHSSFESLYKPFDVFLYITSYYGLIFKFAAGKIGCKIFGFIFLVLLGKSLFKIYKKEEDSWINATLISFVCFIALAGFISAVGRVGVFGPEQAYSGRYNTPVFMAWASFLIIYKNSIIEFAHKSNKNKFILIIIPISLFIYQVKKIDFERGYSNSFEKKVSAMSLELGINDIKRITKDKNGGALFHSNYKDLIDVTNIAKKIDLSVFSYPLLKDVGKKFGEKIMDRYCSKKITSIANFSKIDGEKRFHFIKGVIKEGNIEDGVESFYLSNNKNIIGYVILNHDKTEFKGYSLYSKNIYLYDINNKCKIKNSEQ